jgi:ParB family chromosome partitioning protein
MWDLHDRIEHYVDESTCRGEIESFRKHGQLVPVLGRPLKNDAEHDVELIYGARRLFVARHLNCSLLAEIREISDTQAIIAMDIENRHRLDVSPYERGISYARWLRGGHFKSQDELAHALRVSPSLVSRHLALAKLPSAIVAAFVSPKDICETWGLELAEAGSDRARKSQMCERARTISALQNKPPPREIYKQLLTAVAPGRKVRARTRDEVVCGSDAKPLFRIRHQTSTLAILLARQQVSASHMEQIRDFLTTLMYTGSQQQCPRRGHAAATGVQSGPSDIA